MDNDGYKDIYVSNGIFHDLTDQDFMDFFANEIIRDMTLTEIKQDKEKVIDKMPSNPQVNAVFHNNHDLTFTNVSKEWGMDIPSFSNGAAYGDLDNDGDLDLIVNNVNAKAFVYKNKSREILKNNYPESSTKRG
ncbi:MAG: FG-GAP-like repeat-containing protein [Flavobacteriaceae bacterium]|nr:FG-GAP-like repeat-containing protein [Flavobacteriaceae bacterium]